MTTVTFARSAARSASVLAIAATLVACQNSQFGEKTQIGAAAGAAGGGLLAAATGASGAGIAAGVLLGGLLGGVVGNYLDEQDKEMMASTTQRSLESGQTGQTSTWRNPDSGHYGSVTPTDTYQRSDGTYCRDFQQTVTVDGETETATGTACRQPDGSWRVV